MRPSRTPCFSALLSVGVAIVAPDAARAAEFVANHLFVGDATTHSVRELDANGAVVRLLGSTTLVDPVALAFGPDGALYVLDERSSQSDDDSLVVLSPEGDILDQKSIGLPASFDATGAHLLFSSSGTLYVSDANGSEVHEYDLESETILQTFPAAGLSGAASLSSSPDGHVFAGAAGNPSTIVEFESNGVAVATHSGTSTGTANPVPLIVRGPRGALYVLDQPSGQAAKLTAIELPTSGPSSIDLPDTPFRDITIGPDGDLWLLGGGGNKLVRVASDLTNSSAVPFAPAVQGRAIAFAPFRFKITLDGKVATVGANPVSLVEKNDRLVYFAGQDRGFLVLQDKPSPDDLVSHFEITNLLLSGVTVPDQDGNVERGHWSLAHRGSILTLRADVEIRATGVVNSDTGYFKPKSLLGTFSISNGSHYFTGELKSTELLK